MTTRTLKGRSLAEGFDYKAFLENSKLNFLEIGCFDGFNLGTYAPQYPDRVFYGIDPFISDGHVGPEGRLLTEQRDNLKHNIEGLENVKFFEMTSKEFYTNAGPLGPMNIGAVFIDGAHVLEHIKADVDLALALFMMNENEQGVVAFHDLRIRDVQEGIAYLQQRAKEAGMTLEPWPHGMGIEKHYEFPATNGCFLLKCWEKPEGSSLR